MAKTLQGDDQDQANGKGNVQGKGKDLTSYRGNHIIVQPIDTIDS